MIEKGFPWHFRRYADEQSAADRLRYAGLEEAAREARLGLWTDPDPVPPWAYRKTSR